MYRWAMAGVAGALGAELLGQGDWYEAPKWVSTHPAILGTHVARIQRAGLMWHTVTRPARVSLDGLLPICL